MAKRRGRKKFRKYLKGQINFKFALSTLGATTGILGPVPDTLNEKAWVSSCKCVYALEEFTDAADDGPILLLVAHSDYTLAQVEEWIENTNSWTQGSLRQQEIAARKIRRIGMFHSTDVGSNGIVVLNDGKPITTKLGFQLVSSQTLNFIAYNTGASPLATTGPNVTIQGHANLWPN